MSLEFTRTCLFCFVYN